MNINAGFMIQQILQDGLRLMNLIIPVFQIVKVSIVINRSVLSQYLFR
jgi:hypothetical protein